MQHILQVHNYYGSTAPSGENLVVDRERAMLEAAGHPVTTFTRHSDTIRNMGAWGKVLGGLSTPWNPVAAQALRDQARRDAPDIIHVHNTFPLISPAIFPALAGIAPRVITLHNYRPFCAAGIPMRHGTICTECLDSRSVSPALRHGCYRDSRAATAPLAASIALHRMRGTWHKDVDAFIVFSEFQRDKMIAAGLPAERIHIKPNFYDGDPTVTPWAHRQRDIVFVGRLTREKGVHSLIAAWRHWGADAPQLTLIGDGDDRAVLEKAAQGLPVEFLGQRPAPEAIAAIAAARLLILPSEWFEGFPMVFGEAFAHGTPIAASHLGPLPALLEPADAGITFPAADPAGMQRVLAELWSDPAKMAAKAANAHAAFKAHYTARANLERLREIYNAARATFEGRRAGAIR